MSYNNVWTHQVMLSDALRTTAYKEAIEAAVGDGDVVVDFGCGTGVLSFFASEAGADRVHAIDRSKFIKMARKLACANDYRNIEFFAGDGDRFELAGKADVLVSEWMGHFALHECMFEPLLALRDRCLTEGGLMIPERVVLKTGLVTDADLFGQLAFFRDQPYGIDFSDLDEMMFNQFYLRWLQPGQLAVDKLTLAEMDMATISDIPHLGGTLEITADTTFYGLCAWFDATLIEGVTIRTGPTDARTHWKQIVFPLSSPVYVDKGGTVDLMVRPLCPKGAQTREWQWRVSAQGKVIEHNSFALSAWLANDRD